MEKWTCKCGTVNDTRFCTSCGTPKEQAVNASAKQEIIQNASPKENTPTLTNYANAARTNKKLAGVIILAVLLFAAYFGYNKWVDYRYDSKCNEYIKVTTDFKNTISAMYDLTGDPEEEARENVISELRKEAEDIRKIQEYFASERLPESAEHDRDGEVAALQKHIELINDLDNLLSYTEPLSGKDVDANRKKFKKLETDTNKDCDKFWSYQAIAIKKQPVTDLVDIDNLRETIGNYCSSRYNFDESKWREEEKKRLEEERKTIAQTKSLGSTAANDAAKSLIAYHNNITKKDYKAAYDCTSPNWQSHVGYNGWADGFKTTVKSEVSDIKAASSSDSRVVLNYVLTATDNPGGTKKFNGTAVMVKTNNGWKIDSMENKAK